MEHLEKRKYIRHEIQLSIEYKIPTGQPIEATTVDISMGGLAMISREEIPVGTVLAITAPKILRWFSMQGEVVDCKKCDLIAGFRHHVKVLESDSKWNLVELLEHCVEKETDLKE